MRIVHVVRQFHPSVGGLENVVWELALGQLASGHSVKVVTLNRLFGSPGSYLPAHETLKGIEITRISYFGSRRYPIAVSVLRHVRDADIVHVHGIDFFFDYLAVMSPFHRRTLVVSTHGGFFHTAFAARLKRLYFATITRLCLSRYAGVAAVSIADGQTFGAIRRKGLSFVENGVNIEKYRDASSPTPKKTMVSIGRFSFNKRLDRLVSFFAALRQQDPGWQLRIAGVSSDMSGDDVAQLLKTSEVDHAAQVSLAPSDEDIRRLLAECSVIASTSEYEGFGIVPIEGMSAGLYPILSDIPPFQRLVSRTEVGTIVDFDDTKAAAGAFAQAWSRIASDYARYRDAAMRASANYSWKRVGEAYEALYQSVLGTRTRSILDAPVQVSTFDEACKLLDERARRDEPGIVIFANAHTLNTAFHERSGGLPLRDAIIFNDGIGVDIASRMLFGKRFPENLNGTDFIPRYLRHTTNGYRIFLLGGRPGIAERAAEKLLPAGSQHEVVGCCHGYISEDGAEAVTADIRRSGADILLVAMGNPKQEMWLRNHLAKTGCRLGFGVGALFDFVAEAVPRAPDWVQSARVEWLYRLAMEPRRLWRRYLVEMPIFLLRVARQWCVGTRVSGPAWD